jgi:hypothetical protein
MRTKLACIAMAAALTGTCGGDLGGPASSTVEGLALVWVEPSPGPASLARSRPVGCPWCTTSFSAEVSAYSPRTLSGVNLWLDGWSGTHRCLYSQHDSPADGFTLVGGQLTKVGFSQASVDCAPPFSVDRVDVRLRSGDTLVYQGSWPVSLSFVE